MRQAVARPRHRQSVCIHNIHVAATCRPSVLGSATKRGHMWLNKVASVLGPLDSRAPVRGTRRRCSRGPPLPPLLLSRQKRQPLQSPPLRQICRNNNNFPDQLYFPIFRSLYFPIFQNNFPDLPEQEQISVKKMMALSSFSSNEKD